MFDPTDVLVLHPDTKLKHWQEQGVLFHPSSNSTLLLSSVLVAALKIMQSNPVSLNQISSAINEQYPDLNEQDKGAIYEAIEEGITSLVIDGIVRLEKQLEVSEP